MRLWKKCMQGFYSLISSSAFIALRFSVSFIACSSFRKASRRRQAHSSFLLHIVSGWNLKQEGSIFKHNHGEQLDSASLHLAVCCRQAVINKQEHRCAVSSQKTKGTLSRKRECALYFLRRHFVPAPAYL